MRRRVKRVLMMGKALRRDGAQFSRLGYTFVESCSIVNQNIVKSKVKFKINHVSMYDYNYDKLWLSLKEVSL